MSGKYADGFPMKHKPSDPPPLRGTIIERGRTPSYALGWRVKADDYRILSGRSSLGDIWDGFIIPRWHAGPVKEYPIECAPRVCFRGHDVVFYLCLNHSEKKMKYVMENLEGLIKMSRDVIMLPDDLPDESELMWRRMICQESYSGTMKLHARQFSDPIKQKRSRKAVRLKIVSHLGEINSEPLLWNTFVSLSFLDYQRSSGGEDHNQPFYYLKYEESEEDDGKITASGIFQSLPLSAVLGAHFSGISPINSKLRSKKRPVGALVHAIQAIKRAIAMRPTGEEVKPPRPWGDYSKANWGDHKETREGPILTTTNLTRVVEKLKDRQWEKIIDAAIKASKVKNETIHTPDLEEASMPASSVEPFELVDDDSDLAEEGGSA